MGVKTMYAANCINRNKRGEVEVPSDKDCFSCLEVEIGDYSLVD